MGSKENLCLTYRCIHRCLICSIWWRNIKVMPPQFWGGVHGLENFLSKHLTPPWTNNLIPPNEHSKFEKWIKITLNKNEYVWKMWIYLCKNVYSPSIEEIITTKMCKKIYDHGQCVFCVTLKFQATSHFCTTSMVSTSCSLVQLLFNCISSFFGLYAQSVTCVYVDILLHRLLKDPHFSWSSSFIVDHHLLLIVIFCLRWVFPLKHCFLWVIIVSF